MDYFFCVKMHQQQLETHHKTSSTRDEGLAICAGSRFQHNVTLMVAKADQVVLVMEGRA